MVIGREPGHERILRALAADADRGADEAGGSDLREGKTALSRFLQENAITTVAFGEDHAAEALDAYSRFGKGRHPAALDFGDCCAYATASLAGEPLLCIGDDFAKTDLPLAGLDDQAPPSYPGPFRQPSSGD